MNVTSHFIGIKLRSDLLVDLYVRLQKSLWMSRDALEFQNILSAHVTLHYLPTEISPSEIDAIRKLLDKTLAFPVNLNGFSYFWDRQSPKLCYLSLSDESGDLYGLNSILKQAFSTYTDIPENNLDYIPHTTLFKVRDAEKFLILRGELEGIIKNELVYISGKNLFHSFGIFRVNSGFSPEIQIQL